LFHAKGAKEKAKIIDLPKSRVSRPLNPAHNTRASFTTHSYGLIKKFPARVIKCENSKIFDSAVEEFELKSDDDF